MERHAPWFRLLAVLLVTVGLVTLAAPAPAHAMDPQLILALASAAGAVALVVGYLIVANSREKQRAASLEGVYACAEREASGPMGCGGPASPEPAAVAAAPAVPMAADDAAAPDPTHRLALACPGSQAAGPMGCDGPADREPASSASYAAAPAPTAPAPLQAQ
jgi:hypothetical protein